MVAGKRYQVFSVRESRGPDGKAASTWVKAGSAWVNRDGSLNVYLDVLPLDGKLHVREALERREAAGDARMDAREGRSVPANGSPAMEALGAMSMGGH